MKIMKSPILFCCTLLTSIYGSYASTKLKPNFIVILTDDQGYNDLSCYGSATIKTPNLDKMAKNGIRFTDFYAQPVSGASRTALLTGSYPLRVAEIDNQKRLHPFVHPNEFIIPELLKSEGYTSACVGKWDINGHLPYFPEEAHYPTEMGFDYYYGMASSNDIGVQGFHINKELINKDELESAGINMNQLTQLYTKEAIGFIKENEDKPFFLYLAHSMPHIELGVSEKFKGKSNGGIYGDVVEEIDWSVGEIIKTLKELKLEDNTYIIYFSDNGPWLVAGKDGGSAYPLRSSKLHTWEGGVRVPCIMSGGDIKSKTSSQVVKSLDILPTLLALSGAELPEGLIIDGQDLSPLLFSKKDNVKLADDTYLYYYDSHLQAVRKGDWKLVLPRPATPEWLSLNEACQYRLFGVDAVKKNELYNLRTDISERRNIAHDYPEIVTELMILVERSREEIGDYNKIGTKARFFENNERRTKSMYWYNKEQEEGLNY